jgi:hypothetical protein
VSEKHSTPTPRRRAAPGADSAGARKKHAPSGHVSTKPPVAKQRPSTATKPSAPEVLPARLSKHELRPMINKARRHARAFERHAGQWAVELRLLQDAGVHETYGRKSFGEWAELEFADFALTESQANKLSQQGRVILALQRNERVDPEDPRTFPGTTGARGLASVLANHGEQKMLEVFDHCPPQKVVARTVKQAMSAVLPPPLASTPPPPPPDHDEFGDEPEEIPPKVQELRSHVERLHDYLHDISCADDADPIAVARAYEHFLTDAQALRPVLDAVLPGQDEAPFDCSDVR